MNDRASRIVTLANACTIAIVGIESALVAAFRDRLTGVFMFLVAVIPLSSVGNYFYGFPLVDDEREVQGLMLGGMTVDQARAQVARGRTFGTFFLRGVTVVLATVVAALLLTDHRSTAAIFNGLFARGAIVVLVLMIPLALFPYVVIAAMLRKRNQKH